MKTAKGIQGIKKLLVEAKTRKQFHVFTVDTYVGFVVDQTIEEYVTKHGAVLLGFTGNGITVEI